MSSLPDLEFFVASDLHYGVSREGDGNVEALARHVCERGAGALLLGGDLAHDAASLDACLALFRDFAGPKLAVPGNHDVWTTYGVGADSWSLHEDWLPDAFERHGVVPLHQRPHTVQGVGFVGSMGWYDYSFRDDIGIEIEHYRAKTLPGTSRPIWNDARFANFPHDDEALTALLDERLGAQLAATAGCRAVVALVHHVVMKDLLIHPRWMIPTHWRFANAFLGSERLGDRLRAAPAVTQVFCGHIHHAKTIAVGRQGYTTVGGDYRGKQLLRATPAGIVERTMFGAHRGTW